MEGCAAGLAMGRERLRLCLHRKSGVKLPQSKKGGRYNSN